MTTTTPSVQRPTTYNATHGDENTREYNPISFKFVPIPNSQATSEDLAYDLGDDCTKYYNIARKSFYITIAPSGADGTVLNETFPSSNQEHVLYAVPNTNNNVIYKLKNDNTETYKCSGNGVKTLSLGDTTDLSGKSISTISIGDVKVQARTDGELLIINSNYTDANNTVNSINSDGLIYVEVPSDLDVDYIELRADDIYLKGNFSSSGNSAFSNLYVCKYPYDNNNNDIRCVYSQGIYPSSVVSISGNTTQITLGSSTVQFTNETDVTRNFLKVDEETKTGDSSINLADWEASGEEENSEYLLYNSTDGTYVKIGNYWYNLINVTYSINELTKDIRLIGTDEVVGFDTEWASNPQYIKKIRYMKTVKVSDANDETKFGIFSRVQNQFLPNPNIPHSSEVQRIIQISSTNPSSALTRFNSLDVDNKLVIDINDSNKVIFSESGLKLGDLNYRLEDTTQESGAGA